MDRELILNNLDGDFAAGIETPDYLDYSTNDYIKQLVLNGAGAGTAICPDVQTGGRGRLGRTWQSAAIGEAITMSVYVEPKSVLSELSRVTLITALAVHDALLAQGIDADVKWPNDLLIGGRKICGILCELIQSGDRNGVIIGIGINVNQKAFPEEISDRATSLRLATGKEYKRELIVAGILKQLCIRLSRFEAEGWQGQRTEYESVLKIRDGEIDSYGG